MGRIIVERSAVWQKRPDHEPFETPTANTSEHRERACAPNVTDQTVTREISRQSRGNVFDRDRISIPEDPLTQHAASA